jgi:hypothetical protein
VSVGTLSPRSTNPMYVALTSAFSASCYRRTNVRAQLSPASLSKVAPECRLHSALRSAATAPTHPPSQPQPAQHPRAEPGEQLLRD